MATSRKRATRRSEAKPRPRSARIRMAVDGGDGSSRRVVIGPARRTADVGFSLVAVTVMAAGLGALAWRTQALVHHASPAVIAVLVGLWLGLSLLAFVLTVQVAWRLFGREEIAVRGASLTLEAHLLGGRVRGRIQADRRLVSRLDELPRSKTVARLVYPKFRLVFVHEGEEIATTSVLTQEEGAAALAMVRRILPS